MSKFTKYLTEGTIPKKGDKILFKKSEDEPVTTGKIKDIKDNMLIVVDENGDEQEISASHISKAIHTRAKTSSNPDNIMSVLHRRGRS